MNIFKKLVWPVIQYSSGAKFINGGTPKYGKIIEKMIMIGKKEIKPKNVLFTYFNIYANNTETNIIGTSKKMMKLKTTIKSKEIASANVGFTGGINWAELVVSSAFSKNIKNSGWNNAR